MGKNERGRGQVGRDPLLVLHISFLASQNLTFQPLKMSGFPVLIFLLSDHLLDHLMGE